MVDDLKWFLYKKLLSVEGFYVIVVLDRDGVFVIKVVNDNVLEYVLWFGFLFIFVLVID